MASETGDVPAATLARNNTFLSSPLSSPARSELSDDASVNSAIAPHSHPSEAAPRTQDDATQQAEALSPADKISTIVRHKQPYYNRKFSLETVMDGAPLPPRTVSSSEAVKQALDVTGKPPAAGLPSAESSTAGSTTAVKFRRKQEPVKPDGVGKLHAPNKRFLERDITGKLAKGVTGPKTQREEIQAWIDRKNYTKFQMMPAAAEYVFEYMDRDFVTEPYHCRNKGRKLLLGKDGDREVWAIMPAHRKHIYACRLITRNGVNDDFTVISKWEALRASIDELDYPFQAFVTKTDKAVAWAELHAVICYVFLLCNEVDVAFSNSSKSPNTLSTAMTHIKKTYDPNDEHDDAADVDRSAPVEDSSASPIQEASGLSQLETVNNWLQEKGKLGDMQRVVSDPSIYVFKDFKAGALKAKGIGKAHNRALFLGENDRVETWAVPYREPNNALLGWVLNLDKTTAEESVVQPNLWSELPTLTFPFEMFKDNKTEISWRKMMYTMGYVMLACGEAEVALNLGNAFFKHFRSIPGSITERYGHDLPPDDWPDVRKPGDDFHYKEIDLILAEGDEATDGGVTPTNSPTGWSTLAADPDLSDLPAVDMEGMPSPARHIMMALDQRRERLAAESAQTVVRGPVQPTPVSNDDDLADSSTFTAPDGEYRSLEDFHVAQFLQETRNINGKRPHHEDNAPQDETRGAKYLRLAATRAKATKFRLRQAREVERLKKEGEQLKREHDEARHWMRLLQERELGFAAVLGDLTAEMTDQEWAEMGRLGRG